MTQASMKVKRLIFALLALLFMVGFNTLTALAADSMSIEVGEVTASITDTEVKVPVSATANPGYASGIVTLEWDKDKLELTNVEFGEGTLDNESAAVTNSGRYKIAFGDDFATQNFTGTGTLFTLTFKVPSGAIEESIPVKIADTDIQNCNIEDVSVTTKNGVVDLFVPKTVTFREGETILSTVAVKSGDKAAKPADPEKEGCAFDGWYQDAECNAAFDFEQVITADTTIYAKFVPVPVTGISIATPGKTAYTVGEELDVDGMEIKAEYSDGTSHVIPLTADMVSGFDSSVPVTSRTLTITYGEKTTTYDVSISEAAPVTYNITVSADGNGTASADPTSGVEGTEVTLTATPKDGYKFKEWQVVSGGVTVMDNKFTIGNENVEVKAIFEKEHVHEWGEWEVTTPATETAEGVETRTCKNDSSHTETRKVAKLGVTRYAITVNSGANGSASASAGTAEKDAIVTITATPNAGYEIDKITYTPEGGSATDITSEKSFTMPEANVTVNVTFKKNDVTTPDPTTYKVTFVTNEGTEVAEQIVNENDKAAKPKNPKKEGYTFAGWYKDEALTEEFDFNAPVTADVTVYAKWIEGSETPVTYTVIVSDDGNGSALANPTSGVVGTEVTLAATPKGGYKFKEWQVVSGGVTVMDNKFTIGNENVEVKAIFEKEHVHEWGEWEVTTPATETAEGVETRTCKNDSSHTETRKVAKLGVTRYAITVNSGANGSASASAGTAEKDAIVTITATPNAGYEIDKITYTPEGGSATDITSEKSFTMPEANVTVNVTFKKNDVTTPDPTTYKVTFVTNEGTEVAEQIVNENDKAAKPKNPKKEGYTFAGWYKDEALTEEFDFNAPVTADVTVYAKWIEGSETPVTYTVTVSDDKNGSALANPTSGVEGTEVTLTITPNEGYQFMKWVVVSGGVTVTDNKFTIGTADVQVMAIFEEIPKATKPDTTPENGDATQTSNNGTDNQTSSNGGTTPQAPSTSGVEVKTGDTVKDDKTNTSYVITSTDTNNLTVTYVAPTNKSAATLTVPDTVTINGKKYKVTEIKANAFKNNKKLKKITIGKNIKKIGKNAFSGCKNLKNVNIKTTKLTKKTVGANAFKGIHDKAKVKVPKSKLKDYKTILKARGIKGKKQKITK